MKILNPVGQPAKQEMRALPALGTLEGTRIAVLTNHWKSMDRMAERFRTRALDRYAATQVELLDIPINGAMSDAVEKRVLGSHDVAIVGLAN